VSVAADLGRIFEVGFNVGILAYIDQTNISHNFGDLYDRDLQQLKLPQMLKRIVSKEVSSLNSQVIESWCNFFLLKGFLSGLNLFREYIKSTGWKETNIDILYCQCNFFGDNSFGTNEKDEVQGFKNILSQFKNVAVDIGRYKEKGEFLRADTLILLQHRTEFRILAVDQSIFSIKLGKDIRNLDEIEEMRRLLISEINYLRSKSFFSNLGIDTKTLELTFSEDLARFFTAFKREDKESAKLIQAGSYTHSFYGFLREKGILTDDDAAVFNVVGYSDRGVNALSVNKQNLDVLATCYKIYKYDSSPQEITEARKQVLEVIQSKAYRSFKEGKNFIQELVNKPLSNRDGITLVTHTERIDDFISSIDIIPTELAIQLSLSSELNLRQAHAELIKKALVSDETYIFLTGNPGIGKTTAIVEFLKSYVNEGFLFLYVSPRKQVNLDIINKLKENSGLLCNDKLICLNTNSEIIKENAGSPTVQYLSNKLQLDVEKGVHFLNISAEVERKGYRLHKLKRSQDDQIKAGSLKTTGVLYSICEAIHTLIDNKLSNNIVATVSIQSLKKTEGGKDTLRHFENIFKGAYNRDRGVIPSKMQDISRRIKHLFIMIDEITGDDSGVEFLNGISRVLRNYKLTDPQHGFNTKIIVADASIVEKNVINQHLADTSVEPNKIFFRRATGNKQPLSVEHFNFNRLGATIINANSYPARNLDITYNVVTESFKFDANAWLGNTNNLSKYIQREILTDIKERLSHSDTGQVIVYIQDKSRLQQLIEKIKEHWGFEKNKDYLEIHADISEEEKEDIDSYKNRVKVVFMTSSASRGLSFPKAKHILVDIPRFEIEKNLMEVIQVIYRARGEYEKDLTLDCEDKELVFYIADRAVYYTDDRVLSLQESVLSLINILLILKTSVMTRINGAGQLGRENFLMIPIGGKSVSAAGGTFSGEMSTLIKKLKKEHRRNPSNRALKEIYTSLEQLLSRADLVVRNIAESEAVSYLSLRENFIRQFSQSVSNGFDKLLDWVIEPGYVNGSLLLVPLADKTVEEKYEMQLEQQIRTYATDELLRNMLAISHSRQSPESLKSVMKDAIKLIDLLREAVSKTQRLEQNSQRFDQYYALPLLAFISGEVMSEYFGNEPEEPEDQQFRDIMVTYIRTLYPVNNILPISYKYKDFPWVIFISYSLGELRTKLFTDKYLLNSSELNVLNLILSKQT
jgi:hypothetical protein